MRQLPVGPPLAPIGAATSFDDVQGVTVEPKQVGGRSRPRMYEEKPKHRVYVNGLDGAEDRGGCQKACQAQLRKHNPGPGGALGPSKKLPARESFRVVFPHQSLWEL